MGESVEDQRDRRSWNIGEQDRDWRSKNWKTGEKEGDGCSQHSKSYKRWIEKGGPHATGDKEVGDLAKKIQMMIQKLEK